MPLRVLFSASVPKVLDHPSDNEDSFGVADDGLRAALSDGASDSFDSRKWSRLLASSFVSDSRADLRWVRSVVSRYQNELQRYLSEVNSWAVQSAAERGSFASLLGLERLPDNRGIRVHAVGDSVAALIVVNDDGTASRIDSFPYKCSGEFRQRPELLSTQMAHNGFAERAQFPASHERCWQWGKQEDLSILCMTDAVGEWAFRREEEGRPVWWHLFNTRDEADFTRLVTEARAADGMRRDDSTLLVVSCPYCYAFDEY